RRATVQLVRALYVFLFLVLRRPPPTPPLFPYTTLFRSYTGRPAPLTSLPENEELRKKITASFREGRQFMIFDEAHTIEGEALSQALTASVWEDRILGISKNGVFPNTATWISLGNNVEVKGDIIRRAYRICLRPNHDDPENRPADSFRHP